MGAIPKKPSQPPKWRNIDDLSWLAGQSVNDAFSKELYTCSYDSIDQAISYLKSFGPNALISKLDLSDAFHHILVHPCDWKILGSTWPLVMSEGSTRTGYFFTFDFSLVSGVRRWYFLNLLSGCDTRWHSMEPLRNYPPCFGPVALPPQAPLALGILMLCFVPLLTSDLLPIPFKQFLLQRTLCFLASNSTLSPRNFTLILLVSPKSSISLTPGPLNNIVANANNSPLLATFTLFTLFAAPEERPYAECWMSSAELTIWSITFD